MRRLNADGARAPFDIHGASGGAKGIGEKPAARSFAWRIDERALAQIYYDWIGLDRIGLDSTGGTATPVMRPMA